MKLQWGTVCKRHTVVAWLPILSGTYIPWAVFFSFPDGIFSPSFLEICTECLQGMWLWEWNWKKHTINIFKILFLLHNIHGIYSSNPPSKVLGHPVASLWEQSKGSDGKEAPQDIPGNELLLGFSWKLILYIPELGRVLSDEVTWLIPRLWAAVGQVNTCALFTWFIWFSMGKTAAFHSWKSFNSSHLMTRVETLAMCFI